MPIQSELTYGQSTDWQPERPRMSVLSLVVSWPAMTTKLTSPEAPRRDALHRL